MVSQPPSGEVLSLLTALSNPGADYERHKLALEARDRALAASPESYGNLCQNLIRIFALPSIQDVPQVELARFQQQDPTSVLQLQHDPTGGWIQLRQMAGLLLKNALLSAPVAKNNQGQLIGGRMRLPVDAANEIKSALLQCMVDCVPAIRRVASSTIASATVYRKRDQPINTYSQHVALPLLEWSELLPSLIHCLESYSPESNSSSMDAVQGALLTLVKLIEDSPSQLQQDAAFSRVVPLLLKIMMSTPVSSDANYERCVKDAMQSLIGLLEIMPGELVVHMNDYLQGLSQLANVNSSEDIRTLVCRSIVMLLSKRSEYIQPHFGPISEFMLTSTLDKSSVVALEACEFWLTFASLEEEALNSDMLNMVQQQILPQLLPTLLKGMVYDMEKRQELLEQNQMDEEGNIGKQDIAPIFHRTKAKGGRSNNKENDSDSEGDDDDDDDEEMNEWSVRKCCAASLDSMANLYGADVILPYLLPALQESLSHEDPWIQEAGVLALGAIAEGCEDAMKPHMSQLHPFLMTQLTSTNILPQLTSISAWTLSRYCNWAVEQVHASTQAQPEIIGKMTQALLGRILDRNRRVQVACCSSFGVLVEYSGDLMCQYLDPVIRTLVQAMNIYQTKSMMVLLDTIGTMADFLGPAIGEGSLPSTYIPPLLLMWTTIAKANPFDRTILPLMETLASIALNIQISYQPWALETFETSMSIIEACLLYLSTQGDSYDEEDADPIICSIDLLDGVVEGLGENFTSLVASSSRYKDYFVTLLHTLTGHDVSGVRMSAFALMGDLARQSPILIQDGLEELLSEAIANIDPMQPSVCNNAVWAIGEVCVQCENNPIPFLPFAADILQSLLSLLMGNSDHASNGGHITSIPGLAENAAATMGRLAKVSPSFVAVDLGRFLHGWCDGMSKISDPIERKDAFEGFLLSIHANPQCINQSSSSLVDTITTILFAIVSWHIPRNNFSHNLLVGKYEFCPFPSEQADLGQALGNLVQDLKASAGDNLWSEVQRQMPVNVRKLMNDVYHV